MLQTGDKLIYVKNEVEYIVKRISVDKTTGVTYCLVRKNPEEGKEDKEFKVSEKNVEKYFFYILPLHTDAIAEERREIKRKEKLASGPLRHRVGPGTAHYLEDCWD